MPGTDDPFLVTLGFDASTFERLDALRSRYFPPERNVVPAHLCLFHHLPGDEADAIDRALQRSTRGWGSLRLEFDSVRRMGKGVMLPVKAPGLGEIRSSLAHSFARWLTPQDRQPFHPHVTIMNKAEPFQAALAFQELQAGWTPWSGLGDRLILWRYRGGPWEEFESYPLTTGAAISPSEEG